MAKFECEDCNKQFTCGTSYDDKNDFDTIDHTMCDTIDGQYVEYFQVVCPQCGFVVFEYGI